MGKSDAEGEVRDSRVESRFGKVRFLASGRRVKVILNYGGCIRKIVRLRRLGVFKVDIDFGKCSF